jgi:hypothetical protein
MQNTVHCPIVSVDPKTTQQSKKPAEDKRSSLFLYFAEEKSFVTLPPGSPTTPTT